MMQFSYMLLKTYGKGENKRHQRPNQNLLLPIRILTTLSRLCKHLSDPMIRVNLAFSHEMIHFFPGNYTQESLLMRKNFERRAAKSQELMQKVMEISDRDLWRCDPSKHVEGSTYLQVTRLLQGYIENEVDLNRDGQCWETCPHYQLTESYGCFKELYCAKQPKCSGKLLFCTFFVSLKHTT